MDMILRATDDERWAVPFLINPRLVREESIAVSAGKPGLKLLGAVDQMNQILDEGLRHRPIPPTVAPFQG